MKKQDKFMMKDYLIIGILAVVMFAIMLVVSMLVMPFYNFHML
ncbi:hypothetical protein [endosymbiont 'TC1' of Trimyema compressum]|nr:hypothetical protein [endosymbiont 'TC1' of Trimyema compressum]